MAADASLGVASNGRAAWWLFALLMGLLIAAPLSLGIGPGDYALDEAFEVILAALGGEGRGADAGGPDAVAHAIVWELRGPRILLSLLVGAGLGAAGALCQGLFRNELAAPSVLGLSSGAALAVIASLAFGIGADGWWGAPIAAAIGTGLAAGVLLLLVGPYAGSSSLLLTGIALSAVLGALSTLLLALNLDSWDLARRAMAWTMGSFEGRGWAHLRTCGPAIVLGLVWAHWQARDLDASSLGPESAASLGVDPKRLERTVVLIVALCVGGSTAAVGILGFVGLVAPHLARLLLGPSHRLLIPGASLVGAWLCLGVDAIARNFPTRNLAPGALTSLLGGLFFLWLLRRANGGSRG